MKKTLLLIFIFAFLSPSLAIASDAEAIIEDSKFQFELLDRFVESPAVDDVLIIELAPNAIGNTILNEMADLENGLNSLLISAEEGDFMHDIVMSQKAILEYDARRVRNSVEELNRYLEDYGSDIPKENLMDFRNALINLKFIFADTFGVGGIQKDRIYQEIRVDYK